MRRAAAKPKEPAAEPQPRTRLSESARRAQLLELGLAIFSLRNYEEASIDDVAKAAGISKGLLYHYFPTKRDFYVETIREAARRLLAETEMPDSMPPFERMQEGFERYLRFAERHSASFSALLRGGIGSDPEVAQVLEATRVKLAERVLEGMNEPEPKPLVRLALRGWIGFVEATSLDWIEGPVVSRDELKELWATSLLSLANAVGTKGLED